MILVSYITLGAALFHRTQPWNVLESLYFCFTSLGTIGFGDLQPQGTVAQYLASGYILFGMAVVAMCFSLIQTELVVWLRRFGAVQESQPAASSHHHHPQQQQLQLQRGTGGLHSHQSQFLLLDHPAQNSSEDLALVSVPMTTPSKMP